MMSPITRRVLQAVLYEVIAIAVVGPALSFAFDQPPTSTFGLAVVLSTIALTWNYAFNWIFERWESRVAETEVASGCLVANVDSFDEEFLDAEELASLRLELAALKEEA